MTHTVLSGLAAAAMLVLLADGSAIAEPAQKPKPPRTVTYSKTLTFTLPTTTPSKPGKELKANKKK